jgi:hypothetical protein
VPFEIADGPPGVEAAHTWNETLILNTDRSAGFPRFKVDRITGWGSLPEADDFREPRTARVGEFALPGNERGRTLVYEGRVQGGELGTPGELVLMRRSIASLRAAFRQRSSEQVMVVTPHPVFGGPQWFFAARVLSLEVDDEQTRGPNARPWQREFTLSLRQSDPRVYVVGAVERALADGGVLTNLGGMDTNPTFVLTVPVQGDASITHVGLGASIVLRDAAPGDYVVDFAARSVTKGGQDFSGLIDAVASTWWHPNIPALTPGDNAIAQDNVSDWHATFHHAY